MGYTENLRLGMGTSIAIRCVAEELLMNTLKDIPIIIARAGLEPRPGSILSYGCDGEYFILATQDPYGLLKKETFFFYMQKGLFRNDHWHLIDRKKEGAGLGLFKIFYHSHGISCFCIPGVLTEVLAFIHLKTPLRDVAKMARSIHYFGEGL
jgi:hypothetical protein